MGALHRGHVALVRQAREECDLVVVSVFVNPTQFNDPRDLEKYPRDPEGDRRILEEEGVDVLFMPDRKEVYPENDPRAPNVEISYLEGRMEGAHRPGHFRGVLMVLDRLFGMVKPDRAYFGEKDFQQLLVVRALVEQKKWGIDVVATPTVRESNGLALSSRNQLLSPEAREKASAIIATLRYMRSKLGEITVPKLKEEAEKRLEEAGMEVDYVEVADERNLEPIERQETDRPIKGFIAASLEGVRLIDNLTLNP